jgi:hypothetical protein
MFYYSEIFSYGIAMWNIITKFVIVDTPDAHDFLGKREEGRREPVKIPLKREGGDARVRLPIIEAWTCGYLSFK